MECSVNGCDVKTKARGFCPRHLYQFYKHGKIISEANMRPRDRKCSVDGCKRKHRTNGFCNGHNMQLRKHGKIISNDLAPRNGVSTNGNHVTIKMPNHKYANKRGYILRSHLVWEENTGHIVVPPEVIHHKNGVKTYDTFSNLELFESDSEHQSKRHRLKGHRGVVPGGIL